MRRTSHIAVRVPAERVEEAVAHYTALLGVKRRDSDDGQIGLVGENFTIWIDAGDKGGEVLQEFAGAGLEVEKARFVMSGCEVFDESDEGFHVRDPFGMCYHVWFEEDGEEPA